MKQSSWTLCRNTGIRNRPIVTLLHTQHNRVPGALTTGLKLPGREADHSPPSRVEVKARGAVPPVLQYDFMAW